MSEYRICFNQAPHRKDWWTVEQLTERKRFLRKPVKEWTPAKYIAGVSMTTGLHLKVLTFDSRAKAEQWVREDQRLSVHRCEEV